MALFLGASGIVVIRRIYTVSIHNILGCRLRVRHPARGRVRSCAVSCRCMPWAAGLVFGVRCGALEFKSQGYANLMCSHNPPTRYFLVTNTVTARRVSNLKLAAYHWINMHLIDNMVLRRVISSMSSLDSATQLRI
jgi:hypothetical protein